MDESQSRKQTYAVSLPSADADLVQTVANLNDEQRVEVQDIHIEYASSASTGTLVTLHEAKYNATSSDVNEDNRIDAVQLAAGDSRVLTDITRGTVEKDIVVYPRSGQDADIELTVGATTETA